MKLLLDTHLLLWAAAGEGLSKSAVELIEDPLNALHFSAASIWEVTIKSALGRPDFQVKPALLRRELMASGYLETPIDGAHVAAVGGLPELHKDPFDRILIAQAKVEGFTLLTVDPVVLAYAGPIRDVSRGPGRSADRRGPI